MQLEFENKQDFSPKPNKKIERLKKREVLFKLVILGIKFLVASRKLYQMWIIVYTITLRENRGKVIQAFEHQRY